ncbi:MAG TPA: response regulator transcription factor [Candidatus Sulfotelmatobacter sp.]
MGHVTVLPNQDRLRILAADSTAMSTHLLVEALGRDSQFHMIDSPAAAASILALVKRERPHVAVISASFHDGQMSGFAMAREVRIQSPDTRVIMLLDSSERASVTEAFRAGAQGVFCRTEPFRLLAKSIQCVNSGQVWASSTELQYILEALTQPAITAFNGKGNSLLSAREIDVVRCVSEGMTNREIAQRLKLTEHTVKNYLFRIFDKLGVSSRVEVVLYALGNGAPRNPASLGSRRQAQSAPVLARNPIAPPVTIRKTAN